MKNKVQIKLSCNHLKSIVLEYCTGNWRLVIEALRNGIVCEEGTEGDVSCTRYKMVGFNQETMAKRNT